MNNLSVNDWEEAPCGFATFTDCGLIEKVNLNLLRMLGYEQKESLEERNIDALFTVGTQVFYQTHFFPLVKLHGKADEIFFTLKRRDGSRLPVVCNAVRKESGGQPITHCILFPLARREKYEEEILQARKAAEQALRENKDLVEAKKELESKSLNLDRRINQLAEANSDIVQFSQTISHDLQEPIRKIAILADRMILTSKDSLSEENLKELRNINKECVKLRNLAINLDGYISLSIRPDEFERVNLTEIISAEWTRVIVRSDLWDMSTDIQPLPEIDGYADQLQLLFFFLFENLVRIRDGFKPVTITITNELEKTTVFKPSIDRYCYIDMLKIVVFADIGAGERSSKLVDLLHPSTDSKSIRLEFGLASCLKIVNNHFGTIAAEVAAGGSLKITLSLPLKQSR